MKYKTYTFAILKILAISWVLHDTVQYITQRTIMKSVYPAQNYFVKRSSKQNERMLSALAASAAFNIDIQPIQLEKDGLIFQGWTLCDPLQKDNGKWILQAVGNNSTVEYAIPKINEQYALAGFNTLLINNPGVGHSQGTATPKTIGEVQNLALTYLEETMHAEKIVLAGHSLGGAAIGQAILQHTFKPHIEYLVIQQMTFGKLSHIARKMQPQLKAIIKPIIRWTGLEMDTGAASRKLAELHIPEYIINRKNGVLYTHDGVIPGKATLGHTLFKAKISHLKMMDYPTISLDFSHNSAKYLQLTAQLITQWDRQQVQ